MKQKILFVLSLLFGLMFLNAGLNKFFNYMPVPPDIPEGMLKVMGAFVTIGWLLPLIAATEVVGAILVMIPKTRALGAIVLLPIMVGIILTHTINSKEGFEIVVPMLLVHLWILFEHRDQYRPMVR